MSNKIDVNFDIKREEFIKTLASMSVTEINDFIKKNGKQPKPVNLFYSKRKEEYIGGNKND